MNKVEKDNGGENREHSSAAEIDPSKEEIDSDFLNENDFDPEEFHRRQMEFWGQRYKKSRNPLLVWQAIHHCVDHAFHTYQRQNWVDDDDPDLKRKIAEQLRYRDTEMQFELPGWVCAYLGRAAVSIWNLERGLDERLFPDPSEFKVAASENPAEVVNHDKYLNAVGRWRDNPTLEAEEAVKHIPRALGFIKPGKNHIAQQWKKDANYNLSEAHRFLTEKGFSSNQAYAALAERLGQDERTVRRRISNAFRDV